MPDSTVAIGLAVEADQFNTQMDNAAGKVDRFGAAASSAGSSGGGFFGSILGLANPIGAVAGVVGDLGGKLIEAGNAAADDAADMSRLTNTLGNVAKDWDGSTGALNSYIAAGQNLAFTDTDIRDSLGKLAAATNSVEQAQRDTSLAMDFARAKHIDLSTAAGVLAKVEMGNVGILSRYGIEVDKSTTATDALGMLQRETAGAADVFASSQEGASIRAQTAMGEAMETIGGAVMPALSGAMSAFADLVSGPGFSAGIQIAADLIGSVLSGAMTFLQNTVGPVVAAVEPFVTALIGLATGSSSVSDVLGLLGPQFAGLAAPIQSLIDAGQQLFAALSTGNFDQIGAAVSNLLPTVTGALGSIGQTIMTQVPIWAQALIDWVGPMIPQVLAGLGSLVSSIVTWAVGAAGQYVSTLATWATAFIEWIGPMIPPALTALGQLVVQVVDWAVAQAPVLLGMLGQWAQQFIDWVAPAIPPLLTALGSMLGSLTSWVINTGLPAIVTQIGVWAQAFIDWVGPQIPPLLANLGSLLGSVTDWAVNVGLPALLTQIGLWAQAFIDWVGPQIPPLLANLGSLLGSIATWIVTVAAPTAVEKLGELGMAFLGWVAKDAIPFIAARLNDFASAIWGWVTGTAVPGAVAKLKEMGSAMIDGIKNGLSAGKQAVIDFIIGIGRGAVDAIKSFFGISSPSKLLAGLFGLGGVMGGAVLGIAQGGPALLSAIGSTLGAAGAVAADQAGAIRDTIAGTVADVASGAGVAQGGGAVRASTSTPANHIKVEVYIDGILTNPSRIQVTSSELGFYGRNTRTGR